MTRVLSHSFSAAALLPLSPAEAGSMRTQRLGITLIETLVVHGIIGILLAILIPAVQFGRETARRTTCQNNAKQITLACLIHESAQSSLPRLYNGTFMRQPRYAPDEFHFHSWRAAILPQIEQNALYDRIDLSLQSTDPVNQSNVNATIAVFVCPSTSNQSSVVTDIFHFDLDAPASVSFVGTAARSDYEVIGGVSFRPSGTSDLQNIRFGPWGEPLAYTIPPTPITYRKARLGDITDGQSNIILIGERAGRPDLYEKGKPVDPHPYADPTRGMDHHQAAWAISTHFWWLVFRDGTPTVKVNETNEGIFSFHASGANVGMADGSVQFLAESIDQAILSALITRSGGEVVSLP